MLLTLDPLKDVAIEEYALMSQMMLKDRASLYLEKTQTRDTLFRGYVRQLAADVFGLGYNVQYTLPLLAAVDGIASFIMLLDVAFMVVTFFLALLSILLIYSLMMSVSGLLHNIIECG